MRLTSSGGIGAPPPPTDRRLDVSRVAKVSASSRSQLIVGTPTKLVTRSCSISSSARFGSHLYVMTSLAPLTNDPSITGTRPVTWNSGTHSMNAVCGAPPSSTEAGSSGSRRLPTAARAAKASNALSTARCVETAPFGRPVVPEVYRIVMSSSGSMSTSGNVAPGVRSSSSESTPSGSVPWGRTTTMVASISPGAAACIRPSRSSSAITTFEPESSRAKTISSVTHHAFIGTATAPTEVIAANAAIHSG